MFVECDKFITMFTKKKKITGPEEDKSCTHLYVTFLEIYSVIQRDGLTFVCLYFLNYTWYENDLNI